MRWKLAFEYRIPIIYTIIGALWILFSDELLLSFTSDPHQIKTLSTYKGWGFVLITGLLLYALIKRETIRRNAILHQLTEANKKAEESNNLKTAFLSNLSHYIRSPMNCILGFVELLQINDNTDENKEQFLSYINERSQHLLQTLSSIIEISKLQQGQININVEPFHLNDLLKRMIENVKLDVEQNRKEIRIMESFELKNGDDVVCNDMEKVKQVIATLLDNAFNFTEKGEIAISYSTVNDQILLQVKDSGNGILPEKQQHLFNEFMATSSYVCNVNEGAGLGLYLSTGISKLIGGKIWLEDTNQNGSTFCFLFPRKFNQTENI